MLGAEVRQVNERADEPKTASYSIEAKLLKLFVQRPYAVWALETTWHGLAESTKIKATRSVSVVASYVPGCPEPMRGPAGYLAIIRMMHGGLPDIHRTLEEMVAEGDKVATRFIMRAHIGAPAAI